MKLRGTDGPSVIGLHETAAMPDRRSGKELIIPIERIEQQIYLIHGRKVMLDASLAKLYQVSTKRLNEAVKRNGDRFPKDFMFQLTEEEGGSLRSQIATSNSGRGGRRYQPYAFTEHGVAMLSSVLRSKRAVQMNILIVRAFVRMRELVASNKDLAARIEKLESNQGKHASVINILVEEIDNLKRLPPDPPRKLIGFIVRGDAEEKL
jgi:ORF6N domain